MMDLTQGTAPYSAFWVVVTGFLTLVVYSAFAVWMAYRAEVKAEKKYRYSAYSEYRRLGGEDYGMFAFVGIMMTFLAMIPVTAISSSEWYHSESTEAALVRESNRVYGVELTTDEAHALLLDEVIQTGDLFLKLDEDVLLRVDGFSELDSAAGGE